MSRAVMHQALEALEWAWGGEPLTGKEMVAIAALRAALSEPEQEPCAMRYDFDGYGYKYIDSGSGSNWQTRIKDAEPLYAAPTPRKPLTDEEIVRLMVGEDRVQLLYAKPGDPGFSEFSEGAIRELVESGRAIERAHGITGEQT